MIPLAARHQIAVHLALGFGFFNPSFERGSEGSAVASFSSTSSGSIGPNSQIELIPDAADFACGAVSMQRISMPLPVL